MDSLYSLSNRDVTGNAAIEYLSKLLSSLTEDDAKVLERIIEKDLKCGVQVSTANAVWSGLIKEYPVMLCSGYEQKLVDKINFPAYVQLKMDGMRFNAIVRDGKVEFRSRNGKELNLLGNLEKEFAAMAGDVDCVFDGELLVVDGNKIVDRQTGNGILSKANKGTISAKEAAMVSATVWDVIPYVYFTDGLCPVPYATRFATLQEMNLPSKVNLVEHIVVDTLDAANIIFEDYLAAGMEGIILKDPKGIWEDKRAKHQIKFKGELECDLKIVDVEDGTGKYEGMIGALVCESSDGVVKVNVGSGFNDDQRKSFKKKDLVGKIVAVKYNARIKNKLGDESLFLPIFIEVREDKDVADASVVIK
jgi:ATP-dependent DNA ligase